MNRLSVWVGMVSVSVLSSGCSNETASAARSALGAQGCFTSGSAADEDGGSILIEDAETRGVVPGTATAIGVLQEATMTFTYLGETEETVPLGSGLIRHQVGLKLRAQDPCNTLYVMWRLDDEQIAIQVKRNPGEDTSAECGNAGYGTVRYVSTNVPAVSVGQSHTLYARVRNQWIRVYVDGLLAWEGSLVTAATPYGADFTGDIGWRTDNASVWMELDDVGGYDPDCP